MDELKETTKIWKDGKTFSTYEEAAKEKEKLLALATSGPSNEKYEGMLVKIRRCGKGGALFKIKTWMPASVKGQKRKKEKNVNKKVRSRQEG